MVTCWERDHLLALVGDVFCIFVTFPCGILGQVWYLIVSRPDICHLFTFKIVHPIYGHFSKAGVVVVVLEQICEICLRRRAQRRTISAIIQVGLLKVGRRLFVISFYF